MPPSAVSLGAMESDFLVCRAANCFACRVGARKCEGSEWLGLQLALALALVLIVIYSVTEKGGYFRASPSPRARVRVGLEFIDSLGRFGESDFAI